MIKEARPGGSGDLFCHPRLGNYRLRTDSLAAHEAMCGQGPGTPNRTLSRAGTPERAGRGTWQHEPNGPRRAASSTAWRTAAPGQRLPGPGTPLPIRRQAAVIFCDAGYSMRQIADVFGISHGTIRQDLQHCPPAHPTRQRDGRMGSLRCTGPRNSCAKFGA